jgi:hypothetical protein
MLVYKALTKTRFCNPSFLNFVETVTLSKGYSFFVTKFQL